MVRPLLVKERVVSGFNASRKVIFTSKTGIAVEEKRLEDVGLEALLDEDLCQIKKKLAQSLGVTQQAIAKRLKAMGMKKTRTLHLRIITCFDQ